MSARNQPPIQCLTEWLNIATEELSLPAKERISLEIKAHFEEAVECHQTEGLAEAGAQAKALAELGDAVAAEKRFRREHLTEADVKRINGSLGYKAGWVGWIYLLVELVVAAGLVIWSHQFDRHGAVVFAAISFFGLTSIRCFLSNPGKPKSNVPAVLSVSCFMDGSLMLGLGLSLTGNNWIAATGMVLVGMSRRFPDFRLMLKLRRIRDVWQEMPPPGAAAV